MFIFNLFRKFNKSKSLINRDLQKLIEQFEELEKENAIMLEEIKVLKKLLYGLDLDIKKKLKK